MRQETQSVALLGISVSIISHSQAETSPLNCVGIKVSLNVIFFLCLARPFTVCVFAIGQKCVCSYVQVLLLFVWTHFTLDYTCRDVDILHGPHKEKKHFEGQGLGLGLKGLRSELTLGLVMYL